MNDTTREIEMVHVLRHSFRPSEQFENALGAFVKPGLERPRFLIQTIASLALDTNRSYSAEIYAARLEIERSPTSDLQIGPHVAARQMGSGALKLLFQLDTTRNEDNRDTNRLSYLAMINRTKRHLPSASEKRDLENKDFTFYAIIGSQLALPINEIRTPAMALKSGLESPSAAGMYRIMLDGLPGSISERVVPTYVQPLEQAS